MKLLYDRRIISTNVTKLKVRVCCGVKWCNTETKFRENQRIDKKLKGHIVHLTKLKICLVLSL